MLIASEENPEALPVPQGKAARRTWKRSGRSSAPGEWLWNVVFPGAETLVGGLEIALPRGPCFRGGP